MANERLYQFPSKASPVPADIIFAGDSGNSFDEVNITIAQLISAYPNLSGIAGLTLGANTYAYANASAVLTAGSITALAISLLANSNVSLMQGTLGYVSTPAASLFAGWDANKNLSANSFLSGYTTTATAAATTTLTVGSAYQQYFTGTTTQTVVLPVTSTLALGQSFLIVNNSTGAVTVQSSGANNIQVMAANTSLIVTCISLSGTTAASWNASYMLNSALSLPLSIVNGGTGSGSVIVAPTATSWAGWDSNKNLSANSFLNGYSTTVTAAGTTTLTVASSYLQFFTGTTTQTVQMPVVSTLALGQQYCIINNSSGNVTVQSSGSNTIITMGANTIAYLTCISLSGTGAASWYYEFSNQTESVGTVTSVGTSGLATGGPIVTTGTVTVTGAAKADQETATSSSVVVTPSVQQYHPSACQVWGSITVSGGVYSVAAGYNVSSVSHLATGEGEVIFNTSFASANYAVILTLMGNNPGITYAATQAAGDIVMFTKNTSFTNTDYPFSIACFGVQ